MHSKTAQKIIASQKHPASPTLFLGNLGFEATDDSIRTMFDAHAAYGPAKKAAKDEPEATDGDQKKPKSPAGIRKVRMGTFEDTGLCKGFVGLFLLFSHILIGMYAVLHSSTLMLLSRRLQLSPTRGITPWTVASLSFSTQEPMQYGVAAVPALNHEGNVITLQASLTKRGNAPTAMVRARTSRRRSRRVLARGDLASRSVWLQSKLPWALPALRTLKTKRNGENARLRQGHSE